MKSFSVAVLLDRLIETENKKIKMIELNDGDFYFKSTQSVPWGV